MHARTHRRSRPIRWQWNWQSFLAVSLLAMVVLYVVQTNNQAALSYRVGELTGMRTTLEQEIASLDWEVASARSLTTLAERARSLNLIAPASVSFLDASFGTVAAAETAGTGATVQQ